MVLAPDAGISPVENSSDIIWGFKEMDLSVSVVPSFIIVALANRRPFWAVNVSIAVLPGPGGIITIPTSHASFDVPPLAGVTVPLAYVVEEAGERDIYVLFGNEEGDTFILTERIYVPTVSTRVLRDREAWKSILPAIVRQEVRVGSASLADVVEITSAVLGASFYAIDPGLSPEDSDAWWGSIDPVCLIDAPIAGGV
jgi:hypothetical protein